MRGIAIIVVLFAVLVVVAVCVFQRRLIYFPSHEDAAGKGNQAFRPLSNAQGEFVGYFREAPAPSRIVLAFHGNGGEAIHRDWIGAFIPTEDVTVVLAEYPGYGARHGEPSEGAIEAAALEIYDLVTARWQLPVTVLGESLGTGVASFVAAERPIDRLALISPFTSLVDAAKTHYPFLPVGLLLRDLFDSERRLKGVSVPLHVIHGTSDEVVPFALGQRLLQGYPGTNKALTELPGVGHNDIARPIVQSDLAEDFRSFVVGT